MNPVDISPRFSPGSRALAHAVRSMISWSREEEKYFLAHCEERSVPRLTDLSQAGSVPQEVFFVVKGLIRVIIQGPDGVEHSVHFAMENQFIADYASFIRQVPSVSVLQAIEPTEVVVLPRSLIEWGYQHLAQGDRLGRFIAEFYFVYHDNRINNLYARSPKERYDSLEEVFPGIFQRVPQHMIASYLGITPVHLSRLKRADRQKRPA